MSAVRARGLTLRRIAGEGTAARRGSIELEPRAASTARALRLALALREPGSTGKTERLTDLATRVALRLGLSKGAAAVVELAASVHDVGRLAVPDQLLAKSGPLNAQEWQELRGHVVAAVALLEDLPELRALAPIVRAAHERWDGDGYPDGAGGEEIPLPSRIIAACDAYVAMTSDRPFREAHDSATALQQLRQVAGRQLDPGVTEAVAAEVSGREIRASGSEPSSLQHPVPQRRAPQSGRKGLIAELDSLPPIPALSIARDRLLDTLAQPQPSENETITQLEVDPGLVIQVLRAANSDPGQRRVTTLADALSGLGWVELRRVVEHAPALDFVWPKSASEAVLERFRLHAVAVQRATLRLADAGGHEDLDELAVLGLLHDVGRLALLQLRSNYGEQIRPAGSPEERLRIERRLFGLDHAAVGGIAARQWGLPERLAEIIGQHHNDEGGSEAQLLCLADALVHHTQGRSPLPARMVKLGYALGLAAGDLRSITFELPHSEGSRRLRAEPCPLSERELQAVRALAARKVYGEIAHDLGVSTSTVRTHLHNAYTKLGVADRTQAVLLATERGWL